MDPQVILVFLLFSLAILALGRMIYRSLRNKNGCAANCGKCAASDFSDIKPTEARS